MSANQSMHTGKESVSTASPSATGCIIPTDCAGLVAYLTSLDSAAATSSDDTDTADDIDTSSIPPETTTTSFPPCVAAVLSRLSVSDFSFMSAERKSRDLLWTSGHPDHHLGIDNFGSNLISCAGPTPAPGLKFPMQTQMMKIVESHYTTRVAQLRPFLDVHTDDERKCCGLCFVYFSKVDVLYWPAVGANTACLDTDLDPKKPASLATIPPTNNTVSTTIGPDGFTYTSPSIYVAYHDISASDRCSQVGPIHRSITVSFAPEELSTIVYDSSLFLDGGIRGITEPFQLSNLPCPPQSLIDQQEAANGIGFWLPQRPTYAAIIAPPPSIQTMEPAWRGCQSYFAFDPPKTLVPASAMIPIPTPTESAGKTLAAAKPSPTFDPPPTQTQPSTDREAFNPGTWPDEGDPSESTGGNVAPTGSTDSVSLIDLKDSSDPAISAKSGDPGISASPPGAAALGVESQPLGENHALDTPSDNPQLVHNGGPDPVGSLDPAKNDAQDEEAIVKAGATAITPQGILVSGVGSNLIAGHLTLPLSAIGSDHIFTAAGQTVTALADGGLNIAGTTIKVGDPAVTVQGIPFSVAGSKIILGHSSLPLPEAGPGYVFTAAGQTVTLLSSSRVAIDGTTLTAKGPGITVSGTSIALGEAGLIIGHGPVSTANPTPSLTSNTNSILTVADHKLTRLDDGASIVDGATVSVNEGLVVDPKTPVPQTMTPATATDGVVINGFTLRAADGPYTVSDTTFTLATGSAGVILSWQNGKSSGVIASPTVAESYSIDAAGTLVPQTDPTGSSDVGILASAIMHGFGPPITTSVSGPITTVTDHGGDVAKSSAETRHSATASGGVRHQVKSVSGIILFSFLMARLISL